MASAKRIPKVSRISRDRTVAYARKQKPPADEAGEASGAGEDAPDPAAEPGQATPVSAKEVPAPRSAPPASAKEAPGPKAATAMPVATDPGAPATATITPPPSVEPWPDATPVPMKPVEPGPAVAETERSPGPRAKPEAADERSEGSAESDVRGDRMKDGLLAPPGQTSSGAPPKISAAATRAAVDAAPEDPTRMPGPREIPTGSPEEPAPPPGRVPPGDSRSLRRRMERHEFVLIYRIQTYIISRFGEVGTLGQWRVVEYPTQASASHSYAKECSRFVSEGFSDYRA